jgi:hypothetical protein
MQLPTDLRLVFRYDQVSGYSVRLRNVRLQKLESRKRLKSSCFQDFHSNVIRFPEDIRLWCVPVWQHMSHRHTPQKHDGKTVGCWLSTQHEHRQYRTPVSTRRLYAVCCMLYAELEYWPCALKQQAAPCKQK